MPRSPMDQRAYPVTTVTGVYDQCAALPMLRARLYALVGGQTTSQVRDGDRWQSFHPGNPDKLRHEITRLELLCESALQPRAVRAGPPRPVFNRFGYASPYRTY